MIQKKNFTDAITANIGVVEELIGINESWFRGRGWVSGKDYNTLTESGTYSNGNGEGANCPIRSHHELLVFKDQISGYIIQMCFSNTDPSFFIRFGTSTNMRQAWTKVVLE